MRVREVMTRNAVTIGVDETLVAAARKMKELGVGALPVLEDGTLSGIVTDRDLAVRATAAGADPRRTRVREAMTPQVVACTEEDELAEAAHAMEACAVRRLIVLDGTGHLAGMLSVEDIANASTALAAEVLRHARDPALHAP
ncbi:CBS domain-containing protein [Anaeromyxobacter terrae]|uniref:CBS domain-containing protein n=1 Tax=Anaeromyxobacter terrae TaxID=2925406 RepID=UPI001F576F5B|nr:CBS domain-containing protein [Anaeromyxobacter sp. SG22]